MNDLPGKKKRKAKQDSSDLSRRDFLKISGASAAVPLIARAKVLSAQTAGVPVWVWIAVVVVIAAAAGFFLLNR